MNKKLQFVLQKLIHDTTQLRFGYSSSAKDYEKYLASRGVKLPFALSCDYKYPDNMTAPEYEVLINTFVFYNVYPDCKDIMDFGKLTDKEIAELDAYITQKNKTVIADLRTEWNKLVTLNPMLKNVVVDDINLGNWVCGVLYCFHPDDIKYFLSIYNLFDDARWAPQQHDEFQKLLGECSEENRSVPGWIIEPMRVQKMLDAIRIQMVTQKNNNQGLDK